MKNLDIFLDKTKLPDKGISFLVPRKYYRRLHEFMEEWVYGTLGKWRDYKFFSFDRLVLATFLVVIVSGIQLIFFLIFDFEVTYLLYLVGVFLAAWLGGTRTAFVAMSLSVVVNAVLFQPTLLHIFTDKAEIFQLCVFVFGCAFIAFLVTSVAQARRYRDFVTEQLRGKEQSLVKINSYILSLLESISDGFIACDNTFTITYVNSSMLKLINKKQTRIVGRKISTLFPKLFTEKLQEYYAQYANTGIEKDIFRFDWQLNERWFLVHVHSKDGVISIYFDDITTHKQREQKKDFFIRAASHELKTPITSMKLFLEIIQSSYKSVIPKEVENYLTKIQGQTNKMMILINTFLDLSRIEEGVGIVLDRRDVDIDALVREAVEMFRFISGSHIIKFESHPVKKVFADKERVMQVVVNLISNAMKYSPKGGAIKIQIKQLIDTTEVSVADSGIGIDKQYHTKIFKYFFRINENKKQTYPGLGVGLGISYSIIKKHYGRMRVESEVGKGSTFYFTLPHARPHKAESIFKS